MPQSRRYAKKPKPFRTELRLPMELGQRIRRASDVQRRSVNQQVILLIERGIKADPSLVAP